MEKYEALVTVWSAVSQCGKIQYTVEKNGGARLHQSFGLLKGVAHTVTKASYFSILSIKG